MTRYAPKPEIIDLDAVPQIVGRQVNRTEAENLAKSSKGGKAKAANAWRATGDERAEKRSRARGQKAGTIEAARKRKGADDVGA